MFFESDPFPSLPRVSPQAVIQKLEYEIKDWERDLKERPNPMMDPIIHQIILDIKETILIIQEAAEDEG